jgi:hypothetical protein|tara:strand:+ start:2603 stop:3043 length:441 start_codon:yes stop_codon:yes gene_type:complete
VNDCRKKKGMPEGTIPHGKIGNRKGDSRGIENQMPGNPLKVWSDSKNAAKQSMVQTGGTFSLREISKIETNRMAVSTIGVYQVIPCEGSRKTGRPSGQNIKEARQERTDEEGFPKKHHFRDLLPAANPAFHMFLGFSLSRRFLYQL